MGKQVLIEEILIKNEFTFASIVDKIKDNLKGGGTACYSKKDGITMRTH